MNSDRPPLDDQETLEEYDRPRGILSKRDRQFLLEESYRDDLAAQSRRNVRSRIRERLRHAILDFFVLDEYLEARDRERVFAEIDEPLKEGLHATLALLYRAADQDTATFESWLEGGLTHIEIDHRSRLLVDSPHVELDVTPGQSVDPETVDVKIDDGRLEELTPAEMRYLMWKVGNTFGGSGGDDTLFGALGEYARRFEEETILGGVLAHREEDQTGE